jgi:hypothetical protein
MSSVNPFQEIPPTGQQPFPTGRDKGSPLVPKQNNIREIAKNKLQQIEEARNLSKIISQKKHALKAIPTKIRDMLLKRILKDHAKSVTNVPDSKIKLPSLELSRNQVSKLEKPDYIPTAQFKEMFGRIAAFTVENLNKAIDEGRAYVELDDQATRAKIEELRQIGKDLIIGDDKKFEEALKKYNFGSTNLKNTPEHQLKLFKHIVEQETQKLPGLAALETIIDHISTPINQPPLEYKKDDVVDTLRLLPDTSSLIDQLKRQPSNYLYLHMIEQLVTKEIVSNIEEAFKEFSNIEDKELEKKIEALKNESITVLTNKKQYATMLKKYDPSNTLSKNHNLENGVKLIKLIIQSESNQIPILTTIDPSLEQASKLSRWHKNLTPFTSVSTLSVYNEGHWLADKFILWRIESRLKTEPGFAYKLGLENKREILAGKLLRDLGLDQYVIKKEEVQLKDAKIEEVESPEGIVSEWLIDAEEISTDDWENYWKALHTLNNIPEGFTPERGAALKAVADAEVKLLKMSKAKKSIQSQAIIDMLFLTYDSHLKQYLLQNGEAYNFDFARFLSPGIAFLKEGETFIPLRSALIDHPFSKEPMSEEKIQEIKDWNLDQLEKNWRKNNLIGDPAFFELKTKELKEIEEYKLLASENKAKFNDLKEIAKKHSIPYIINGNVREDDEIIQDIQNKIRKECFSQIHPKAFKDFKERIAILKDYVANANDPSPWQAFKLMYPLYQPFIDVLTRIDENNPCTSIGHEFSQVWSTPRSLESIIEAAKKNPQVSPNEVQAMEKALAELKKQAFDASEFATMAVLS